MIDPKFLIFKIRRDSLYILFYCVQQLLFGERPQISKFNLWPRKKPSENVASRMKKIILCSGCLFQGLITLLLKTSPFFLLKPFWLQSDFQPLSFSPPLEEAGINHVWYTKKCLWFFLFLPLLSFLIKKLIEYNFKDMFLCRDCNVYYKTVLTLQHF